LSRRRDASPAARWIRSLHDAPPVVELARADRLRRRTPARPDAAGRAATAQLRCARDLARGTGQALVARVIFA
jgi:hypothetical protein